MKYSQMKCWISIFVGLLVHVTNSVGLLPKGLLGLPEIVNGTSQP